jgi:drug/metabolite transporter (DMT)-like permease
VYKTFYEVGTGFVVRTKVLAKRPTSSALLASSSPAVQEVALAGMSTTVYRRVISSSIALKPAAAGALVLAAACWGCATVITKHVLTDVPPLTLLVLQLTVSVVFLWMIVVAQRLRLPRQRARSPAHVWWQSPMTFVTP